MPVPSPITNAFQALSCMHINDCKPFNGYHDNILTYLYGQNVYCLNNLTIVILYVCLAESVNKLSWVAAHSSTMCSFLEIFDIFKINIACISVTIELNLIT